MNITTSVLPAAVQISYNGKLLAFEQPDLIHGLFADRKRMPKNSGEIFRMRRMAKLKTALVPLGNSGITPPGQTLSAVDIDAKIEHYGTWLSINEQVTLTSEDPILNEAAKRLGIALRETEDELLSSMLATTASQINCTGGVSGDSPTEITRSDVDTIVRTLKNASGKMISDNIEGEDKFATAPVRNAYWALCSTQLIGNLEQIGGFIPSAAYPNTTRALQSEWGSASNIRYVVSALGSVSPLASANGFDVYNIFNVAKESYAYIEQDAATATFIYTPPQIAGGPLALNSTCGFKFASACKVTYDIWLINQRATRLN